MLDTLSCSVVAQAAWLMYKSPKFWQSLVENHRTSVRDAVQMLREVQAAPIDENAIHVASALRKAGATGPFEDELTRAIRALESILRNEKVPEGEGTFVHMVFRHLEITVRQASPCPPVPPPV